MEEKEIAWPETILYYGLYFGLGLAISAIIDYLPGEGLELYQWFLAPAGIWTMMLVDREVLYKGDEDKGFWDLYNEEDTTDRKNSNLLRKYVVRPTMGILLVLIILDRTGIYSF
jgi:hypothetical protein